MTWWKYIQISRPKLWIYLFGSFLVGAFAAETADFFWPALAVFAFYFTFPANLLLYGSADISDLSIAPERKDNPIKSSQRWPLINAIILWNLPFLVVWLADEMPVASKWALLGFIVLAVFNVTKPIIAKNRPVLDMLATTIYIFPGIFAYGLLEYKLPDLELVAAVALWCIAGYLYGSIPTIPSNKKHGIVNTPVLLGPLGSLGLAMVSIATASYFGYRYIGIYAIGLGLGYLLLMLLTFVRAQPVKLFWGYRFFPAINLVAFTTLAIYLMVIAK